MKEIKLTQGKVALVDDEDYEYLNQWKWFLKDSHSSFYAIRDVGTDKRRVYMHRLIMNTPEGMEVDHIDHNGLNNQKYNLRNCTHKQNHANMPAWGKSKFRGVDIRKDRKKRARATININGKQLYLGNFHTEEEAALAYNEAAIKYYGEFANLNVIGSK